MDLDPCKRIPLLRFRDDQGEEYPEWQEKKIIEIGIVLRGSGLSKGDICSDGKLPCILYGDLYTQYSELIVDVFRRTNVESPKKSKHGDILLPASDVTPLGIATASALLSEGVQIGGDIHIIRLKSGDDPSFLSYCLNFNKCTILRIVTGSTVRHTSTKDIAEIKLKIPKASSEQQKIADFLSSVDRKIELVTEQINQTREFKKGLLQQMFV